MDWWNTNPLEVIEQFTYLLFIKDLDDNENLQRNIGILNIGNQYKLQVGGDDYYLDLLFYNLKLRCYVVIELKTGKFKPEYAGKLNFYLSAVDHILKSEIDNP